MPAYCRVPLARLNILPFRPLLQIHVALLVKYMQMYHWVQQLRPAVTLATRSPAYHRPRFIYHGENLLLIIFHIVVGNVLLDAEDDALIGLEIQITRIADFADEVDRLACSIVGNVEGKGGSTLVVDGEPDCA